MSDRPPSHAWSSRLHASLDRWFLMTEPRAAGNMGIYRIIFAIFYLWHVACYPASMVEDAPTPVWHRLFVLEVLRRVIPYIPAEALEAGLIGALVALLLGWRTRLATLAVLLLGFLIEAQFAALQMQKGRLFLTLYIPLFMLIAGDWGATYSLDALRRRAGKVLPSDDSGYYFLPARALLILLSLYFAGAGFSKVLFGTWLTELDLMSTVALSKNIKASLYGYPIYSGIPWFSSHPWLYQPALFLVVGFEALFPLTLFGGLIRRLYIALALIFHGANALFLLVTFTPVFIVYPMFLDLQGAVNWLGSLLRRRFSPVGEWARLPGAPPGALLDWIGSGAVLTGAAMWSSGQLLQTLLTANGFLNWQTIWLFITPLAVVWLVALITSAIAGRLAPRRTEGVGDLARGAGLSQ